MVGCERRSIDDILADEGLRNDNKHVQVGCKGVNLGASWEEDVIPMDDAPK